MSELLTPESENSAAAERALTAKELAFVEHYVRYRNSTQAYTHAYNTQGSYAVRCAGGREVMARPRVQAAIDNRVQVATEESGVDVGWLLRRFLDIATADPRELIGLKVGACRYCYGENHGYQWREREYLEALEKAERQTAANIGRLAPDVKFPDFAGGFGYNATRPPVQDCPECHGEGIERFVPRDTDNMSDQALLLYGGVKVKRDGYEIIIADQQKALEMVGRIMGAFTDNVNLNATVKGLVAVAEIATVDQKAAARAYQDWIKAPAGIAANKGDPRVTGVRPHGKGLTPPSPED